MEPDEGGLGDLSLLSLISSGCLGGAEGKIRALWASSKTASVSPGWTPLAQP